MIVVVMPQAAESADLMLRGRRSSYDPYRVSAVERLGRPAFNWNYKHRYGPAYNWPDGSIATPERVLLRPGLEPIGLYDRPYPYCLYGAATYRAQGGRVACY